MGIIGGTHTYPASGVVMTDRETLSAALDEWKTSLFRLEALDRYQVDAEQPLLSAYLRGERVRPYDAGLEEWLELRRQEYAAGKRRMRVHAIAGPVTPYLAFEIEWAYIACAKAGEDIRLAHWRSWAESPFRHQPPDFYVLDDARVVVMEYSAERRWVGGQLITAAAEAEPWLRLRDLAISAAVPLTEYLERVPSLDLHQAALRTSA